VFDSGKAIRVDGALRGSDGQADGDALPRARRVDGLPDRSELDCVTRLVVEGSAASDLVLRTAAASLLTVAAAPFHLSSGAIRGDRQALRFYADLAAGADASVTFPRPTARVAVTSERALSSPFRPHDGRIELLHFRSPFVTLHPGMRDRYAAFTRNATAWAQHWRHDDGPRPTLCVIHGFMGSPYWFNSAFFALPWFYGHGYDVLLYTLPFHGRRKGVLSPFSGHEYFTHGLAHINEAMAHAVHDFRLFVDHLERRGVTKIGVTGLSLGGYTTALLAAVEDRLHLAIPNAPVTEMAGLIRDWFPAGQLMALALRRNGIADSEITSALAVHSPLTYQPVLAKDRLMIIAGLGDRLAPPDQSQKLWEHWDRCNLHWFPGNHALHVRRGRYLKQIGRFMQATHFND